MNWLLVLECGETPHHERVSNWRVLQDFGTILWCVSVKANWSRGVRTYQCHRRERVETIEYEISIGRPEIVAGHDERGLECPFFLADPYRRRGERSTFKTSATSE